MYYCLAFPEWLGFVIGGLVTVLGILLNNWQLGRRDERRTQSRAEESRRVRAQSLIAETLASLADVESRARQLSDASSNEVSGEVPVNGRHRVPSRVLGCCYSSLVRLAAEFPEHSRTLRNTAAELINAQHSVTDQSVNEHTATATSRARDCIAEILVPSPASSATAGATAR